MRELVSWFLPPIAGALIGYITNMLAIKMLFRPLTEKRIMNFRIPFTPGILPRERQKLADSIGSMVEKELITAEVLKKRLAKDDVREKLEKALFTYTEKMLDLPLSALLKDSSNSPANALFPLIKDFLNSEIFNSFLDEILKEWLLKNEEAEGADEDGPISWVKSRFKNIGEFFIPSARDMIKNKLIKDFEKKGRGKNTSLKTALEKICLKYPDIKIREFFSLRNEKKKLLDSYLTEKTLAIVDDNIDNVLSSVNVRQLVVDRINSLDMIRVEKIILDVMAGQLKWINVFGGILGALIGFVQVLIGLL